MRNRLVLYATLIWGAIMCGWLVVDAIFGTGVWWNDGRQLDLV